MRATDTTSDRFLKGLTLGGSLGRGGMSRIRTAASADGRRFAVKFPNLNGGAGRAASRALLHREFGYLSEISHPNVVKAYGLVRVPDGRDEFASGLGMVMEYLDGGDLVSLAGGPPRIWVPVATRIVRAVDHLHRSGIVHRDLKPRNILMRSGRMPCLIDFALAARTGGVAPRGGGTAAYQRGAGFEEADPADDVYALAVLVHELWFGALPFGRRPTPGVRSKWRGIPEPGPTPGVRGLRRLAGILADVLAQRRAALSAGIRPLRHALESESVVLKPRVSGN